MTVTIRDVAKRANVGIATVSRVLNNNPSVSEETRQRVLDAIAELDYSPNPIARRLSTGRTLTIGVIVPFFTLPDFVKRLQGVQHALAESQYDLVLFNVESPTQRDKHLEDLRRHARVDGLLVIALSLKNSHVSRFQEANIPIVLIDSYYDRVHRVLVDHVDGGMMATNHLIELGHRKIAFVSNTLDDPFGFLASRQKYEGYCKALEAAGLPFRSEYLQQGAYGREKARQMGASLLALADPPTAVFAATDTQAIGVLEAARDLGVKVPEELAVIGYNDIRDAEYMDLTTIRQPLFDSGVKGAELLIKAIEEGLTEPQEVLLPIELVVRKTTAPPSN